MAEKKTSQRDATLVSVLERMANHIQNQDKMLDEIIDRQLEISKAVQNIEYQKRLQQSESDLASEKLLESFGRYRSDMLRMVNEQDHLNRSMDELLGRAHAVAYAAEHTDHRVEELKERFKAQEKAVREHYEHALKQAEGFPSEIADTNRNFSKLHMDTEKQLGQMHSETQQQFAESNRNVTKQHIETEKRLVQMHNETQRQLEKLKSETMRRLFALDGIESALQTLLIRTEPPEKKPLWIARFFKRAGGFCRQKLAEISKIKWPRWKDKNNR